MKEKGLSQVVEEIPDRYFVSSGMTELKIVMPACHHFCHPRMLLGGDLLKEPFERSQPVWEIPDRYFVSSGMTELKIVIPACHHFCHPRMLLSGDLLKRLFERSQPVWEIPDRYFVSSGMTELKIVIPACFWAGISLKSHLSGASLFGRYRIDTLYLPV